MVHSLISWQLWLYCIVQKPRLCMDKDAIRCTCDCVTPHSLTRPYTTTSVFTVFSLFRFFLYTASLLHLHAVWPLHCTTLHRTATLHTHHTTLEVVFSCKLLHSCVVVAQTLLYMLCMHTYVRTGLAVWVGNIMMTTHMCHFKIHQWIRYSTPYIHHTNKYNNHQ